MSNKRVVLVNSNRLRPGCPPVGLDYLAAACVEAGIEVDVLDLCYSADVGKDIRDYFSSHRPDLIAVTIRNLDDVFHSIFFLPEAKTIIDQLKQACETTIVVGGSGFSIAPEQVLDYLGLELGVAGEGEEALPMLVRSLGDVDAYSAIPGLVYRSDGEIKRNPLGQMDLSKLTVSRRGYVDHTPYIFDPKAKNKSGAVQTKRGCGQTCIYCIVPQVEGCCMRLRPVDHIVDEIESLAAQGVTNFWFADSEFNYPEEHARQVCEEIVRRRLHELISWSAYIAPKPFSSELAKLMKQAGCTCAINCIDHGSDDMLEVMGKDFRAEDIRNAVAAGKEAGLDVFYCLMLGGPGETMDSMLKALETMASLKPIKVGVADPPGMRVYPNSPLADIVREEGLSVKNRNLSGKIKGNADLLQPIYYFSQRLAVFAFVVRAWRRIGNIRHRCKERLHK